MKRISLAILAAATWVSAMETADGEVPWEAQWIWQQEAGPANAWVAFRKKVSVDSLPQQAIARISADSKYWLWINGELVVFEGGAARGPRPHGPWQRVKNIWELPPKEKPSNSWYDEIDITNFLRRGDNTIAVLVWYWGRETLKGTHVDSGQGGFLFQAKTGDTTIVSDSSWKVKADVAYACDSGDTGKSIVPYNVKYDARKELGDWTMPEYADDGWAAATEKGRPPSAPWFEMEKNYVPPLVNHGLKHYANYPESQFPFTSSGETIRCILPFNKQITPYLEVECEAGQQIEISTDNRNNKINGYYTTKQGGQSFESFSWMSGNEVHYKIPAGVKVISLKYRWTSVGELAGDFQCSDPFYTRLWWMGRNTLFVCARDNFMDCPDRERALWIGDVADQAGYLFYCMDDAGRQLLKKAIRVTMAFSDDGVFGALGPLRLRELPSQSLQFVDGAVWQYYMNTGDKQTLRYAYPYVRAYLAKWTMGSNGLPEHRRGGLDAWDWYDWGQKSTLDKDVIQPALYFIALKSASKMARVLGEAEDVAWYERRIRSIAESFDREFWHGEYYSSDPLKFQDDRANSLAIVSELASKDKHQAIARSVLIPNYYCSPHFEWMVEESLCLAGMPDAALKRMKDRYQSQVERENMSTLYEMFPNGGTYNHAWNAPNTILSKYIAGVSPTKPGWREFHVLPAMAHLDSIETTVPSQSGDIEVHIRREDGTFRVDLVSPPGTAAIVGIPNAKRDIAVIRANNAVIWRDNAFVGQIEGIEAAGSEEGFMKFRVSDGTWSISADYR